VDTKAMEDMPPRFSFLSLRRGDSRMKTGRVKIPQVLAETSETKPVRRLVLRRLLLSSQERHMLEKDNSSQTIISKLLQAKTGARV